MVLKYDRGPVKHIYQHKFNKELWCIRASVANKPAKCRIFTIKLVYGGYSCLVPLNYRSIILCLHTTVHLTWFSKFPGEKVRVGGLNVSVFFSLGWELKFLFSHGKDWSFLSMFTVMCTSPYCHTAVMCTPPSLLSPHASIHHITVKFILLCFYLCLFIFTCNQLAWGYI